MNYQEFTKQYNTLPKHDPRFKMLCDQYPHYRQNLMNKNWAIIAKIRARKKDTKTVDAAEPVV